MFIRIKGNKQPKFRRLLRYLFRPYRETSTEPPFILRHNVKGNTLDEWVTAYKKNEVFRQRRYKNSIMLSHEMMSFDPDDTPNLTIEKLYDLTRAYIHFRTPNAMYVAVPHFDKDHIHIHIAVSSIEYRTGDSLHMTRTQMRQFKQRVQDYQIQHYPELIHSIVDHRKCGRNQSQQKHHRRILSPCIKEFLQTIVESALHQATSQEHFIERLKHEGIEVYYRKGRPQGVLYNGKKWRWRRFGVKSVTINSKSQHISKEIEFLNLE